MSTTEPAWKPVWTVNGDDASWKTTIVGPDRECHIEATPETHPDRCRVDVQHTKLGITTGLMNVTPDEARAIIESLNEWLDAVGKLEAPHGRCAKCLGPLDHWPEDWEGDGDVPGGLRRIPASLGCGACGEVVLEDQAVRTT